MLNQLHSKKNQAENRLSKLDKSYVSEFESRVTTSLAAAKLALRNAIESQKRRCTNCSTRTVS